LLSMCSRGGEICPMLPLTLLSSQRFPTSSRTYTLIAGKAGAVGLLAPKQILPELAVSAVLEPKIAVVAESEDIVGVDRLKCTDLLVDQF